MKKDNVAVNTETAFRVAKENDTMSILEDPEIFVIDSGATTHSTGNSMGIINMKDANGSKTRVGNGTKIATKAVGSLPFQDELGNTGTIGNILLKKGCEDFSSDNHLINKTKKWMILNEITYIIF